MNQSLASSKACGGILDYQLPDQASDCRGRDKYRNGGWCAENKSVESSKTKRAKLGCLSMTMTIAKKIIARRKHTTYMHKAYMHKGVKTHYLVTICNCRSQR